MNLRFLFIVTAVLIDLLGNLASAQEITGLEIMELVEENQRATSVSRKAALPALNAPASSHWNL